MKASRRSTLRRPYRVESHLLVESLEGRIVLAASIGFEAQQGVLSIVGGDGNDVAVVSRQGANIVASLTTPAGSISKSVAASTVRGLAFSGLAGNDIFTNNTGLPSVADGGQGNDTLRGGSAIDQFSGGDGNDTLLGNGGNDTLIGGGGDDSLDGGEGNDTTDGGVGNDTENGGDGNDVLLGGPGIDSLNGGGGDDSLDGGDGNDTERGGPGNDRLLGGAGADSLFGDSGSDRLAGGVGDDSLDGGEGDDTEAGDDGNDVVLGGIGNDELHGGNGNDSLTGNAGNDSLFGEAGDDRLDGSTGRDQINGGTGRDSDLDAEDGMEDEGPDDNAPRQGEGEGLAAIATPIVFGPNGSAQLSGTSTGNRDVKVFSFTAASAGTLTVSVRPDDQNRWAQLGVMDSVSREFIRKLQPTNFQSNSAQIQLIAGRTYFVALRSADQLPVGFAVDLLIA